MNEIIRHYDLLIDENNDPVRDPAPLREYMDKWDGPAFLSALAPDKNMSVLEIGCGTGRLALRIAPLCGRYTGIDISPKTIARARENLSGLENATLLCADFLGFPFEARFDVICSSLTFMHIREKQRALDKIASLLPPGGRLVLSLDKNPSDVLDYGTRSLRIWPDHPDEMRECILRAGLRPESLNETEFAYILTAVLPNTSEI